jgi:hypothetical protein
VALGREAIGAGHAEPLEQRRVHLVQSFIAVCLAQRDDVQVVLDVQGPEQFLDEGLAAAAVLGEVVEPLDDQ